MMKLKLLSLPLALLCFHTFAQVATGDNVVVDKPVFADYYVAAGTVTINAPVHGDLIVAGGTVNVNDSISQDVLVAGGNVTLNGYIGDDVRCAAGKLQLGGSVAGDFIATGGRLNLGKTSVIGGNLVSSGGEVTFDGVVKGNVKDMSGTFVFKGTAEKDLECKSGKIVIDGVVHGKSVLAASVIELGSEAKFKGDVSYWNKEGSLDFKNSLQGSKATFDPGLEIAGGKWHYLGFASFLVVLWYLGTALVLIALLQYLFSLTLRNASATIKASSLKSLGLGFLFVIGVPVAVILLFFTVVGLPLAFLLLITYVTVILFGTVIVSLLVSHWINNTYYETSWKNGKIILIALLSFVLLKLISLMPAIGPLVVMVLTCMAFGGILQNIRWQRNKVAVS